jgi:hypothetical protein
MVRTSCSRLRWLLPYFWRLPTTIVRARELQWSWPQTTSSATVDFGEETYHSAGAPVVFATVTGSESDLEAPDMKGGEIDCENGLCHASPRDFSHAE